MFAPKAVAGRKVTTGGAAAPPMFSSTGQTESSAGFQMMDMLKANLMMRALGSSSENSVKNMLVLSLYSAACKYGGPLMDCLSRTPFIQRLMDRYSSHVENVVPNLVRGIEQDVSPKQHTSVKSRISFTQCNDQSVQSSERVRTSGASSGTSGSVILDKRIQSILYYVCSDDRINNIRFRTDGTEFTPNCFVEIMVADDVYFKLFKCEDVSFELLSYEHEVSHLLRFVEMAQEAYQRSIENQLGVHSYFFDQIPDGSLSGAYGYQATNEQPIMFTKTRFTTNRSFSNMFFEQKPEMESRVNFFRQRKDFYDDKGIPHTLGLALWGHPGCGKTTCVKTLANTLGRHIFNVHLSQFKTNAQLKRLFFNEDIIVSQAASGSTAGRTEVIRIPIRDRLYVIEDFDACESIISRIGDAPKPKPRVAEPPGAEPQVDPIDMATLLNILDGSLEIPGRVIVITTNRPERIDDALIRPGRFDMVIEFKLTNRAVLIEQVNHFYRDRFPAPVLPDEMLADRTDLDYRWSPAEVVQILFRNVNSPDQAINDLLTLDPATHFKFSRKRKDAVDETHKPLSRKAQRAAS